jgi:hypothetical protein
MAPAKNMAVPLKYPLGRVLLILLTIGTIFFAIRTDTSRTFNQMELYFAANPKAFAGTLSGHENALFTSLQSDRWFLIGYGALFAITGLLQCRYNFWGLLTLGFGVIGALLDVLENNGLTSAASNLEAFSEPQLGMIQTLCVLKFLCSAIAIVCTAAFFRGSKFGQPVLRVLLQVSGALLALGCLLFLTGWRPCSGMFVQVGLLLTILGLTMSIYTHVQAIRHPT